MMKIILIEVTAALTAISVAYASNEILIRWVDAGAENYPSNYAFDPAQRVAVQLSTDSGNSYPYTLSYGFPSKNGTNVFRWSLPHDKPEYLSEHCRLRVVEIPHRNAEPASTHHQDISSSDFTISGIYILSPSKDETVNIGSEYTVRWKSSGVGDQVAIGISTNGGTFFKLIAFADNNTGTNTWKWTLDGTGIETPGEKRMMIQDATLPATNTKFGISGAFTIK